MSSRRYSTPYKSSIQQKQSAYTIVIRNIPSALDEGNALDILPSHINRHKLTATIVKKNLIRFLIYKGDDRETLEQVYEFYKHKTSGGFPTSVIFQLSDLRVPPQIEHFPFFPPPVLKHIRLDSDAVFSISPQHSAILLTMAILLMAPQVLISPDHRVINITDGCACVGGDTIAFSKIPQLHILLDRLYRLHGATNRTLPDHFRLSTHVNAVELDTPRYELLRENLHVCNVDMQPNRDSDNTSGEPTPTPPAETITNEETTSITVDDPTSSTTPTPTATTTASPSSSYCTTYNGSYIDLFPSLSQQVLFLDPPWGGTQYLQNDYVDLKFGDTSVGKLLVEFIKDQEQRYGKYFDPTNTSAEQTRLIVLKAPHNVDEDDLLLPLCEYHQANPYIPSPSPSTSSSPSPTTSTSSSQLPYFLRITLPKMHYFFICYPQYHGIPESCHPAPPTPNHDIPSFPLSPSSSSISTLLETILLPRSPIITKGDLLHRVEVLLQLMQHSDELVELWGSSYTDPPLLLPTHPDHLLGFTKKSSSSIISSHTSLDDPLDDDIIDDDDDAEPAIGDEPPITPLVPPLMFPGRSFNSNTADILDNYDDQQRIYIAKHVNAFNSIIFLGELIHDDDHDHDGHHGHGNKDGQEMISNHYIRWRNVHIDRTRNLNHDIDQLTQYGQQTTPTPRRRIITLPKTHRDQSPPPLRSNQPQGHHQRDLHIERDASAGSETAPPHRKPLRVEKPSDRYRSTSRGDDDDDNAYRVSSQYNDKGRDRERDRSYHHHQHHQHQHHQHRRDDGYTRTQSSLPPTDAAVRTKDRDNSPLADQRYADDRKYSKDSSQRGGRGYDRDAYSREKDRGGEDSDHDRAYPYSRGQHNDRQYDGQTTRSRSHDRHSYRGGDRDGYGDYGDRKHYGNNTRRSNSNYDHDDTHSGRGGGHGDRVRDYDYERKPRGDRDYDYDYDYDYDRDRGRYDSRRRSTPRDSNRSDRRSDRRNDLRDDRHDDYYSRGR